MSLGSLFYRMFNTTLQKVIDELLNKLCVFKKDYLEDKLTLEEFVDFGPVVHFCVQFMGGWQFPLDTIKERRKFI